MNMLLHFSCFLHQKFNLTIVCELSSIVRIFCRPWMNESALDVCLCVTWLPMHFPSFSSLFCFVLNHQCRYATKSKAKQKPKKQSRKLLINWIQFSWRCRRLNCREWEIHNVMRFCFSSPLFQTFFSVRHLMQKTLKEEEAKREFSS